MSVIRAFIAIDLSEELRNKIALIKKQLERELTTIPMRWVPVKNIHLTLKFLGDVSISKLEILQEALGMAIDGFFEFEYNIGQIGVFPSLHRPRVIWIGIEAPSDLNDLHSRLENKMHSLGYAVEDRPFSPHLTLGRVGKVITTAQCKKISQVIQSAGIVFVGVGRVDEICLFKSDLRPTGPVYTKLNSVQLLRKTKE